VSQLPWNQPDWIARAHAWIHSQVEAAGLTLTGPIDQMHARIWSSVMRVPTSSGTLYFKACQKPVETHMTSYLARLLPANLPDLLAIDLDEGWMLMRDAGPMLRQYLTNPADLAMIEPALTIFADLQIMLADRTDELFPLGARDHRLQRLPGMFAGLLEDREILRVGLEEGLTTAQFDELTATLPHYTDMCTRLLEYHVPQSLHHDDFHLGNIFVSGEPGNFSFVFSDWEEICITHPFFSIMHCLRSVATRAGFPDEATEAPEHMPDELNHLRDIYLAPWVRFEPHERLVEILNMAWRVGMVSRALSWTAFVQSIDPSDRLDFYYIVPAWLSEYLLAMRAS